MLKSNNFVTSVFVLPIVLNYVLKLMLLFIDNYLNLTNEWPNYIRPLIILDNVI